MRDKESPIEESPSAQQHKKLWKQAWKMKLSQKIKIFTWKACHESLLTLQNLRRRKIDVEDSCIFCHQPEDLTHALHYCLDLHNNWCSYMPIFSNMEKMPNIVKIACWLIGKKELEGLEKFFSMAWGLWNQRNKSIYEQKMSSPL